MFFILHPYCPVKIKDPSFSLISFVYSCKGWHAALLHANPY